MNQYVFDSGPLIDLFRHYYPDRFPSLWEKFDGLTRQNYITSVREVSNEIGARDDNLSEWSKDNKILFPTPDIEELVIVAEIFKTPHFQAMIRKQERLQGKPVADPFVVAKAKYLNAYVVTTERYTDNAAKLPNVCKAFSVKCINLEEFMELEGWAF